MSKRASIMLTGLVGFGGEKDKGKILKRLKTVLQQPQHKICSDCGLPEPSWVSLLVNPVDRDEFQLAVVCCQECATSFHDLGSDVCELKSSSDDFTEEEVKALENTGNDVVKSIYEAKLSPEEQVGERHKKGFIRHKYQTLKYFSKKFYEDHHAAILEKEAQEENENDEEKKKAEKERKRAEKAEKKAQKEEERKAKEEKKRAEKAEKKKKKEEMESKYCNLVDENSESAKAADELNEDSFAGEDETERQGNAERLVSYKVRPVGGGAEEEEYVSVEANSERSTKRPLRRRRTGESGGDPLASQSDHTPMTRRGRTNRAASGSERRGVESGDPARRHHSPVPGRISRPGGGRGGKSNDPLSSQSDHVSTSRRKRGGRRKDIHWDPSHVPEDILMASRKITASAIANAQESMAISFEKLGFEDIDFEGFQDRVAPAFGGSVPSLSSDQQPPELDTTSPDPSIADIFDDDDDDEEYDDGTPALEPTEYTIEPTTSDNVKPKRSGKGKSRRLGGSSSDLLGGEEVSEAKRSASTGDLKELQKERKKRSDRHAKGDGSKARRKKADHGGDSSDGGPDNVNATERKQRQKQRRKRVSESGEETAESNDQEGGGEGRRRRTPPRSSSRELADGNKERRTPARTQSASDDLERQANRSKSDGKSRREKRGSTAGLGRRSKLHASLQSLSYDHLERRDEDEPRKTKRSSEEPVSDEEEGTANIKLTACAG